jgi:hypothetical protein
MIIAYYTNLARITHFKRRLYVPFDTHFDSFCLLHICRCSSRLRCRAELWVHTNTPHTVYRFRAQPHTTILTINSPTARKNQMNANYSFRYKLF